MNLEEFQNMVAAYGADPQKWPDHQRADAQTFASSHQEAVQPILEHAEKLDAALSLLTPSAPSDLLRRRIVGGLDAGAQNGATAYAAQRKSVPGWRSIAAMVVCAFGLGFGGAQFMSANNDSADISYVEASAAQENWQLAANDLGLEDVYIWVEGSADNSDGVY